MDIFKQLVPSTTGIWADKQVSECILKTFIPCLCPCCRIVCPICHLKQINKISCLYFLLLNCTLLSCSLKLLCFQFQVLIVRVRQGKIEINSKIKRI